MYVYLQSTVVRMQLAPMRLCDATAAALAFGVDRFISFICRKPLKLKEKFINYILNVFTETTKILESNETSVSNLYEVMVKFKTNIESRISDKFFGINVRENFFKMTSAQKAKIENEFINFCKKALSYVEDRFIFRKDEDNWLFLVSCLSLEKNILPNFDTLLLIAKQLALQLDINKLYEEIVPLREIFSQIMLTDEWKNQKGTIEKWKFLLSKMENKKNILIIIGYVLSIPSSSAFSERVFSVMNLKWRDERNRAGVDLIKSELLYFNNNTSYIDFSIKHDENLLKSIKSQNKYKFK